jgi:ankyrin repeat protein
MAAKTSTAVEDMMRIIVSDINKLGEDGFAPFHDYSKRGDVKSVSILLEHGTDVNLQTSRGETALHLACAGHHINIVELLLEAGADVTIRSQRGETAIDVAAKKEFFYIQYLLEKNMRQKTDQSSVSSSAKRKKKKRYVSSEVIVLNDEPAKTHEAKPLQVAQTPEDEPVTEDETQTGSATEDEASRQQLAQTHHETGKVSEPISREVGPILKSLTAAHSEVLKELCAEHLNQASSASDGILIRSFFETCSKKLWIQSEQALRQFLKDFEDLDLVRIETVRGKESVKVSLDEQVMRKNVLGQTNGGREESPAAPAPVASVDEGKDIRVPEQTVKRQRVEEDDDDDDDEKLLKGLWRLRKLHNKRPCVIVSKGDPSLGEALAIQMFERVVSPASWTRKPVYKMTATRLEAYCGARCSSQSQNKPVFSMSLRNGEIRRYTDMLLRTKHDGVRCLAT